MRSSLSHRTVLVALLATGFALLLSAAVVAEGAVKRTASGHPDLTGTYDAATLTPLQRPREYGESLYLTREEAEKIAETERLFHEQTSQASKPDRDAPPEGGDGSVAGAGNVGGYNTFWADRGTDAFEVDGKFRTSILIDPKNGRMPPMKPEAQQHVALFIKDLRHGNDGTAW